MFLNEYLLQIKQHLLPYIIRLWLLFLLYVYAKSLSQIQFSLNQPQY